MEELIFKLENLIKNEESMDTMGYSQEQLKKRLLNSHRKDLQEVKDINENIKKIKEKLEKLNVKIDKAKKEEKKEVLRNEYDKIEDEYYKYNEKISTFCQKYGVKDFSEKKEIKPKINIKEESKKAQSLGAEDLIKSIKEELDKNNGKPLEARDYSKKDEELFVDLEKKDNTNAKAKTRRDDQKLNNNEYELSIGRTATMKIYTTTKRKKNDVLKYRFGKYDVKNAMKLTDGEAYDILRYYIPNLNDDSINNIIRKPAFDRKILYMITDPDDLRESDKSDFLRKYVNTLEGNKDERLDISYNLSLLRDSMLSRMNDVFRRVILLEKIDKALTVEEKREFIEIAENAEAANVGKIEYFYEPRRKEENLLYGPRKENDKQDKSPSDILSEKIVSAFDSRSKYLKSNSEKDKKAYEKAKSEVKKAKKELDELEKD